jgi:peptidoglycan/LPS O-acetylase OafA/YrhL
MQPRHGGAVRPEPGAPRPRPVADPAPAPSPARLEPSATARGRPLERLDVLDGFRAVAVLWVAAYHYLYFWTPAGPGADLAAYGARYADVPLASVGFLGVHLFFTVSGFVILLTLERTPTLGRFILARVIRLWPPLLLIGTATFVAGHLFGPPELRATWPEYLLSLVVIPPQYVGRAVGETGWGWLDGAYWSLWVEVKFYLLIGAAFYLGRGQGIRLWCLYEIVAMAIGVAAHATDSTSLTMLGGFLFQRYLPCFSFGIAAYLAFTGRWGSEARGLMLLALGHMLAVTAADATGPLVADPWRFAEFVVGQAAVFTLFFLFAWRRARLRLFAHPLLAAPGRASYGIYLLHQNIGLIALAQPWAAVGGVLAPVAVFAAVVGIAMTSYRWIEQPLQARLKRALAARRPAPRPPADGPALAGTDVKDMA